MSLLIELLAAEHRRELEREADRARLVRRLRRPEPEPKLEPVDVWYALLRRYRAALS